MEEYMYYVISAIVIFMLPGLNAIFCLIGWHSWVYEKGGHRQCKWCKRRQSRYKVGNDSGWQ